MSSHGPSGGMPPTPWACETALLRAFTTRLASARWRARTCGRRSGSNASLHNGLIDSLSRRRSRSSRRLVMAGVLACGVAAGIAIALYALTRGEPKQPPPLCEDPQQRLTALLVQSGEAGRVGREVDLVRRPLVTLPVLVDRPQRLRPVLERDLVDTATAGHGRTLGSQAASDKRHLSSPPQNTAVAAGPHGVTRHTRGSAAIVGQVRVAGLHAAPSIGYFRVYRGDVPVDAV